VIVNVAVNLVNVMQVNAVVNMVIVVLETRIEVQDVNRNMENVVKSKTKVKKKKNNNNKKEKETFYSIYISQQQYRIKKLKKQ